MFALRYVVLTIIRFVRMCPTFANETVRKPTYSLFGYISPFYSQTSNIYLAPTQMLGMKNYKTTPPWCLSNRWNVPTEGSETWFQRVAERCWKLEECSVTVSPWVHADVIKEVTPGHGSWKQDSYEEERVSHKLTRSFFQVAISVYVPISQT